MNWLYVTQQVRPLRICFLIGHKKADLLEAISINTVLWGGIHNPIIEPKESSTASEFRRSLGVIKDFDPDFVVNLSSTLPQKYLKTINREIVERPDFIKSAAGKLQIEFGLRTYRALRSEAPDIGLSEEQRKWLTLIYAKTDTLTPFIATVYGLIDRKLFPAAKDFLTKKLGISEIKANLADIAGFRYLRPGGVIYTTKSSLDEFASSAGFAKNLVYVGNIQKKVDLLEFWNLRAAGENILFLPVNDYKIFESKVKDFVKTFSEEKRLDEPDIDLQIAPSVKGKEFEKIADWIREVTKVSLSRRMWSANWGRHHKRVVEDIACVIPYHSQEKLPVNFTTEEIEPFNIAAPKFIEETFLGRKRHWAVDLSFIGFYEKNFTIDLPNQEGMQKLAYRDLVLGGFDKVRISDRGLVVYGDSKGDTIHLNPISVSKVVHCNL